MKAAARLLAFSALLSCSAEAAEDYRFELDEIAPRPFELGGYFEQKFETLRLREGSGAYRLAWPGAAAHEWLLRNTSTLELAGKLSAGALSSDLRVQASQQDDALASRTQWQQVMEGGLHWSLAPSLYLDAGKRVLRWGKGYAWNPVAFVERPRDPADPNASREGYVMAQGEWTRSFAGPLSTLTLTGLLIPTNDNLNQDFGRRQDLNPALKLYALAWDTDVDLMWRAEGARPQSFGVDFSRNINAALEVHGEWARSLKTPHSTLAADSSTQSGSINANSWLIGSRYITPGEITWSVEYYRNGMGYSADELDNWYAFLGRATLPGAPASLSTRAQTLAQSGYNKPNPGRDYVYLKSSASEPFGWLYGAAALTLIGNVGDGSWQLQPEVSYTGWTNVELRSRLILFGGQGDAEFSSKSSRWRFETYVRWSF
ncbi:hypothetical protein [Uliginosibacterium sediminicola]|uniref:Alginate export domain-containing protein n=1 Tax=Uliginosibacterium sediminicola TaxID=2024550 RepID=A0ABU9Z0K3_9RHOO